MHSVCPPSRRLPYRRRVYLLLKSLTDRLVACLLLLLFAPFLAGTTCLSAMETGKWPIASRICLGCKGALIFCAVPSPAVNEKAGAWTNLAAGRFFSFLLSLFSVACGEMSFVGPAPVFARDAFAVRRRLSCDSAALRPGLTGLWKLEHQTAYPVPAGGSDRFYYYGCSWRLDLGILWASLVRRCSE